MHTQYDNSEADRYIGEIGEILSRGVELLLKSREEHSRLQNAKQSTEAEVSVEPKHSDFLVQLAIKFKSISTADVLEHSEMSRSTARRRLAELVKEGVLVAEGKGRGACYRLPKPRKTEK